MAKYTVFPDTQITPNGVISKHFLGLGITTLAEACGHVQEMDYGYNSDRDDLMILFKEKMGTCTTKHAVIATLAEELKVSIDKHVGIYAMDEKLVTGTDRILAKYNLPYLPMLHCFLVYGNRRVDLTEDNDNGKNGPIGEFLHTEKVTPTISGKEEYLIYRQALKEKIMKRNEMRDIDIKTILHAREEGLTLLKDNVNKSAA